ncbi:hypothetical protein [Pseudodesulfovibrio indicus]|uniref:hypothetical protein n=1 Tax=Pseudodesulfovibrio indicus TaxID=1716143 RepID=UPI0029315F43|nr:hypothetical protein [Pseudodesulfovibrio indicus]
MFRKIKERCVLLRVSRLFGSNFSPAYYLESNPDVAESGTDPLAHYIFRGWKEGRNPSPFFDVAYYLANNPDVAESGAEPLEHYLRYGAKEGRLPAPSSGTKVHLEAQPYVSPLTSKVNPKVKQVYLHVGMWKTGTTSIQNTLGKNVELLRENGICFPRIKGVYNHSPLRVVFDDNNKWRTWEIGLRGWTEGEEQEFIDAVLHDFCVVMQECESDTLCLSGEGISTMSPGDIENLKNVIVQILPNADIDVLLFVRDYTAIRNSGLQQRIKTGNLIINPWAIHCIGEDDVAGGVNYRHHIEKFSDLFGSEHCHVHAFEESCRHQYGPAGYFLEQLHFPHQSFDKVEWVRANESISDKALSIIGYIESRCPILLKNRTVRNPLRQSRSNRHLLKIRGNKFSVGPTVVATWIKQARADANWLKKKCRIDYTQEAAPSPEPKDIIFSQNFYDDITQIFEMLDPVLQCLVYDYCVEASAHFTDDESSETFKLLRKWIGEHFPGATKGLENVVNARDYALYARLYSKG